MQTAWFIVIGALWALYLVLEGFDFGVGMLLGRVRRDHVDRRVALHAIGPTWAANEVWLVIAVVAMFGAFPGWYAAWASSLYLPLAAVLLALIARNASIELLGKRDDERWRRGWERVLTAASTVAPFCWGLIWTAALRGTAPTGGVLDIVSPRAVLGGLVLVALCRTSGAAFLALRTDGFVRARALRSLRVAAPVAAALGIALLAWTAGGDLGVAGWTALAGCNLALVALAFSRRPGRAFAAGCCAIGLLVACWFGALSSALALPDVAAGDYALTLMTGLAVLLLPLIVAAQACSYWVFRERVTRTAVGAPRPSPVDLIARVAEKRGW
jgi:cytochrome d ubiquinol oxidase subunit II